MNKGKTLVVISNRTQYQCLVEEGIDSKTLQVFCDNARFYDFLSAKDIPFKALDEFLLKDRWREINTWGCSRAAQWIKLSQQEGIFNSVDIPSIVYHLFSRNLVQILKNYLFAKHILKETQAGELIAFHSSIRRKYPEFPGNFYLNRFLTELASEKGIKVQTYKVKEKEALEGMLPSFGTRHKTLMRSRAKKFLQNFYSLFTRPSKVGGSVLAYGSLKHLGSTIEELTKRGSRVFLYDFEYHWEQHRFALKNWISYLIPSCFNDRKIIDSDGWAEERMNEILRALESACRNQIFCFDGNDFTDFIREQVYSPIRDYLKGWAKLANHYENIFSECQPQGIVLDEDYAQRGSFLAAFVKTKGVPVFCISHASLALDFATPGQDRVFSQSVTFVGSEYEREMYAARGWDPARIAVTGIPRYDRLIQMGVQRKVPQKPRRNLKLLYVSTSLWDHSPDQRGFLGSKIKLFGATQRPAFREIQKGIKGCPVELIIKPHNYLQFPMWQEFLVKERPTTKVRVTRHSEDIFKLYVECDAMILSYWSTSLFESAIFGLPTIFVDINPPYSDALYEYAKAGFCVVAKNANEIRREIEKLIRPQSVSNKQDISQEAIEFTLGKRDAKASERVADYIAKQIGLGSGAHAIAVDTVA